VTVASPGRVKVLKSAVDPYYPYPLTLDTSSGNGTINLNCGIGGASWPLGGNFTVNAGTGAINWTGSHSVSVTDGGYYSYNSGAVFLTGALNLTGNILFHDNVTINATAPGSVSGALSGGMSLIKTGPSTLILTGVNTYTGSTTVSNGTLNLGASGCLSGGSAVTVNNSGTLVASALWAMGGINGFDSSQSAGPITVNAGGTLTTTVIPNGIQNGLILNGGTVNATTSGNYDWGDLIICSDVTVGGNAVSTISDELALGDTLVYAGNPRTFTVAGGSTLNITGVIHNGPAWGGGLGGQPNLVVKAGNGTMTLSGTNNIYTGGTAVNGGTLLVNNLTGSGTGTGAVTVNANATLSGIGTIGGPTTMNAGAMLASGTNGSGTLTFSNLTLNASSTNTFVVTTAGGVSNKVVVAGTLSPNGSVVQINTGGGQLAAGTYHNLFTYGTTNGTTFTGTPVFATAQTGTTASIADDGVGHINLVVNSLVSLHTNDFLTCLAVNPPAGILSNFATNKYAYAVTNYLPNNPVTVTVTNADLTATNTLFYQGSPVGGLASGTTSPALTLLQEVANTVAVQVVSQDGAHTNTYTVNVTLQPSQTVPKLTNSVSGSTLTLNWPADHLGYRLLTQTNNLNKGVSSVASDWGPVSGSTLITSTNIPINKVTNNAYYRLVYP